MLEDVIFIIVILGLYLGSCVNTRKDRDIFTNAMIFVLSFYIIVIKGYIK